LTHGVAPAREACREIGHPEPELRHRIALTLEGKFQLELQISATSLRCNLHKASIKRSGIYFSPIRVIENVKGFGTELESRPFAPAERKFLVKRKVPFPESWI
jgi:hypothetical protein